MSSSDSHSPTAAGLSWADLGRQDELHVTGADAVTFIENFTTAKVGGLEPGTGCDGFFCDVRGWVLDLALIRRTATGLLLCVAPGRAAPLRDHLDRYHIREKLELVDHSGGVASLLLAGPRARDWLAERFDQPLPASQLQFVDGLLAVDEAGEEPVAVRLTLIDWYGPGGYLLETAAGEQLAAALAAMGLPRAAAETVTARRIRCGRPLAEDIPEKTLPQELGLDDRAICFSKGCYLGQETVARLDALGHVNRRLTCLAISGDDPVLPGTPVTSGGSPVATVSSAAPAIEGEGWLALAIVPLKAVAAAASLTVDGRTAVPRPFTTEPEANPE